MLSFKVQLQVTHVLLQDKSIALKIYLLSFESNFIWSFQTLVKG